MSKRTSYYYLTIGAFISAIGINLIASSHIVFGGVSGLAIILQATFSLPISLTNLIVNILLFTIGSRLIGKDFLIKSLYVVTIQSLFLQFTNFIVNLNLDLLITSIYGGILLGIGVAIVIYFGGSTGGTDMLALIINHITKTNISSCMFVIDSLIITLGIFFNGINQALYGFIIIFFIKKAIEMTTKKLRNHPFSFLHFSK